MDLNACINSNTRRKPRRWSRTEDALLREAISRYDNKDLNWQEVSTHLVDRTNKDCRKRWAYTLKFEVKRGPWGQDEDKRLEAGVEVHGCRWSKVSEVVGTRQADQCSRRWHECLNPGINRSRWSLLEDSTLETAVQVYGRNWTEIVERFFHDRTPIAARNRYKQRFEKGIGYGQKGVSRFHDQHVHPAEETPSTTPSSSAFEVSNDSYQHFLASSPQPPNLSAYFHLPAASTPPIALSTDGNTLSSLVSPSTSPSFALLEGFQESLLTDFPDKGTYPGKANTVPENDFLCNQTRLAFETGAAGHEDIGETHYERFTTLPADLEANFYYTGSITGLVSPVNTSLPQSPRAVPMSDWYHLSNTEDETIQQLNFHTAWIHKNEN
ncbi:unnamed protein product [Discula destructiva]